MAELTEPNNFLRMIAAGIAPERAVEAARDGAFRYDVNRKPAGSQSGALGRAGVYLFGDMAEDHQAFVEYHHTPLTWPQNGLEWQGCDWTCGKPADRTRLFREEA